MSESFLLIFGLGYTGTAIAEGAAERSFAVAATSRTPTAQQPRPGITVIHFDDAEAAVARATHLLATAAPGEEGDPALARYATAIRAAPALRWIGYFSTTGVYGDRDGGWVDETTEPSPAASRSRARLEAELAWRAAAGPGRALDLFRVAGIYGPGRSYLDDIRGGRARRVVKPGHSFGRIHRDDIAAAVLAAMTQSPPPGARVLNLADDEPAETGDVIAEAARLLDAPPPPEVPYEQAMQRMSEMGRSFWSENRKVSSVRTQQMLGITWRYPNYREGLRAILQQERADNPA